MNIQHSSQNDSWATPIEIVDMARQVLGGIDLDPASCAGANVRVRAAEYYTAEQNGLEHPWFGRVFVNPPGGKVGSKSAAALFWRKLMQERPNIKGAIFLGFSLGCLQTTQKYHSDAMLGFPICVPRDRIRFVDLDILEEGNAPAHGNVLVYVPGTEDRTAEFLATFSSIGACR